MPKRSMPRRRAAAGSRDRTAVPVGLAERLDEGVLRRFILQTFGRTRHTQHSPIVPDVGLGYMRMAEAMGLARIQGEAPPRESKLDLLLTPWTGSAPGTIAASVRASLSGEQLREARIAESSSRV